MEQGPYKAVGEALEVIPRTLAQNCGANVIRTLTKLRAKHAENPTCTYGINGKPIADEVQRTNMAKFGEGSWKDENGKIRKPPDWKAPDIKKLLIEQGWEEE